MEARPEPNLAAAERVVTGASRAYRLLFLAAVGLLPSAAILYLARFQDPPLRFEGHGAHELAIAVSVALSAFVALVTWRCYRSSGEPFLRWLAAGFLAFTGIYAPHGILTRLSRHDMWLFLLYGPFSRVAMAACLAWGLYRYGSPPEDPTAPRSRAFWRWLVAGIAAVDVGVYVLVHPSGLGPQARVAAEFGALVLCLAALAALAWKRPRSPLMGLYAVSLAAFAQSSVAFVLARPWNHQWWLAHAIFSAGFAILGYGVVQAYLTTRAFSLVYGQEEMMERLTAEKRRAEDALRRLSAAHEELERAASTDPLTGARNRRSFLDQAQLEVGRARRSGSPLALLAIDLDHFKALNDRHGHAAGDEALKALVAWLTAMLRGQDLVGRFGGEEFSVLLPDTDLPAALAVAERIRAGVERLEVEGAQGVPGLTVSVGVAVLGPPPADLEGLFRLADARLYEAKRGGRNRVAGPLAPPAGE